MRKLIQETHERQGSASILASASAAVAYCSTLNGAVADKIIRCSACGARVLGSCCRWRALRSIVQNSILVRAGCTRIARLSWSRKGVLCGWA